MDILANVTSLSERSFEFWVSKENTSFSLGVLGTSIEDHSAKCLYGAPLSVLGRRRKA
jgi:hypothetical protein